MESARILRSYLLAQRKVLLAAYLYNLSERQVEEPANYHLPVKGFLGLAVTKRP